MKRAGFLSSVFFGILLLCVSCEKQPTNPWSRFYGFTKADIVGHYEANPDQSVYEALPTAGVVVYDNASVDIIDVSDNTISFRLTIPDKLAEVFVGEVTSDENTSEMNLYNNRKDVLFNVYKNAEGQVRLHGRYRYCYYEYVQGQQVLVDADNYGFDVIKTTTKQ